MDFFVINVRLDDAEYAMQLLFRVDVAGICQGEW